MSSRVLNYEPELKYVIENAIKNKNQLNKQHSDSLNCLINCAEYKFNLRITQNPNKGKNNLFFILEKDNFFTPLFFYDTPSNEIIELIEKKSDTQKLFVDSKKIKSEKDIIDDYEQNKKNKLLLFSYLKFPLININSDNNIKNKSTIIILDEGYYDKISNYSINSHSDFNKNCSILFDIHNLKNTNYLFSIEDIKDCKEIKFKFNGDIHGQKLFKDDVVCIISSDLIINSIRLKMKKYIGNNYKEIKNKNFFVKLNNDEYNNIGILFSFNNKNINNDNIKYDEEFIMKENSQINKIFICIDMWISTNNFHETKDTSNSSSKISNIYYDEEKNININYNINNEYNTGNNYNNSQYNNNYSNNQYNNSNYDNNNYTFNNSMNNISYNSYNTNSNSNYSYKKYNIKKGNKFDNTTSYSNNSYSKFNNYKYWENQKKNEVNYSSYNKLIKIENKYDNYNYNYNNSSINLSLKNNPLNENDKINLNQNYLYEGNEESKDLSYQFNNINKNLDNNIYIIGDIYSTNFSGDEQLYNTNNNSNSNSCESLIEINNKSIFIDINNELLREIFQKYKQEDCISNFSIIKKKLDINMNKEIDKLKRIKLIYFFECFKDINYLSLDIPYINQKGELLFNEVNPTLSSMRLVLKTKKKIVKELKKEKKKNFNIKIIKPNIVKIEYDEIKPPYERDLLYTKIDQIKKILENKKITFNNVLIDKSYFCVLWNISNINMINSSFLAYYSFDLKLIGIFIIKLNSGQWLSSFSYDINNFKDYKKEYDKNIENIKKWFKNMTIDKEKEFHQNFFTLDYYHYIHSQNIDNSIS